MAFLRSVLLGLVASTYLLLAVEASSVHVRGIQHWQGPKCAAARGRCSSSFPCCDKSRKCDSGHCLLNRGQRCTGSTDCCSGTTCQNNYCQPRTPPPPPPPPQRCQVRLGGWCTAGSTVGAQCCKEGICVNRKCTSQPSCIPTTAAASTSRGQPPTKCKKDSDCCDNVSKGATCDTASGKCSLPPAVCDPATCPTIWQCPASGGGSECCQPTNGKYYPGETAPSQACESINDCCDKGVTGVTCQLAYMPAIKLCCYEVGAFTPPGTCGSQTGKLCCSGQCNPSTDECLPFLQS